MKRRTRKIGGFKRSRSIVGALPLPSFQGLGGAGLLASIAGVFLLASILQPQAFSGLRTSAADAAAPVLNIVSMPLQSAAVFVRDVTGLAEIQAENARLTEENMKLRDWYQTALLLEAENKSLRELMNLKLEPSNTYITARILSDTSNTFAKSLLVSAGTADGVKKGQAVIAGDGLIGRIIEAGESTARVLLVTDINSRVPIVIEGSRQHAIFTGQNDHNGVLLHVPPESQVVKGSRVVTSGVGGVFPVGLPVGMVKDNTNEIVIEPFADLKRLMHVRIVDRPADPNLRSGVLNTAQ